MNNREVKMLIRPLKDRIMVRRLDGEKATRGGIILPDTAVEKQNRGVVVAVGPGRYLDNGLLCPVNVKVGETVMFGSYSGIEITVKGDGYLLLREDDLIAVTEEDDAVQIN